MSVGPIFAGGEPMKITPEQGRQQGEALRDAGMALAARRQEWLINRDSLAMLLAIRRSPDRTASTDDAVDDLADQYADGGRWRGMVPQRLSRAGLIIPAGAIKSARPSRHRGFVTLWRGVNDDNIDLEISALRAWLANNPQPQPEPAKPKATEPTPSPGSCPSQNLPPSFGRTEVIPPWQN